VPHPLFCKGADFDFPSARLKIPVHPVKRMPERRVLHVVTLTCYRRRPYVRTAGPAARTSDEVRHIHPRYNSPANLGRPFMLNLKRNKITYFGHSTFSLAAPSGEVAFIDPWVMTNPRCPGVLGDGSVTPTVSFLGTNNFIFEGTDPTVTSCNTQYVQGNPGGGTYTWSASTTSSYNPTVSFNGSGSPYSTQTSQVTVTGNAPSSTVGDTTLSVGYSVGSESAQTPATRATTIRIFGFLQQAGSIQVVPVQGPPKYGYTSYVYYSIYTNPAGQLLQPGCSGISVYESVTLTNTNFPVDEVTGTGGTSSNAQVVDQLSVYGDSPLPSNFGATADQYLGVGGFVVRHNTITQDSNGPTVTNLGPFN